MRLCIGVNVDISLSNSWPIFAPSCYQAGPSMEILELPTLSIGFLMPFIRTESKIVCSGMTRRSGANENG